MRRAATIGATLAASCAAAAAATAAVPSNARISSAGLGPIEIGMSERQVEKAAGRGITRSGPEGSTCTTATLGNGVALLFTGPRLTRVYVTGRRYATSKGIRVGDSQSRTIAAYAGKLKRSPHKFTPGGLYLKLTIANRRLVFSTDGRKVTEISGGRKPEIDYVEGCA